MRDLLGQRQPADVQQRLARVGARLATVVGEILFNSNQFPLARRWYLAAARAAREAGDTYLADIALAGGAYLPIYAGEPREVLAHVLPRLDQGPAPTPAIAWLLGFAAKAYVSLGDRTGFERAIEASRISWTSARPIPSTRGFSLSCRRSTLSTRRAAGETSETSRGLLKRRPGR
ncbi:hypothetical protein AB0M44_35275 [Streptosporangium subroseum]|uniref:hypothetical protein n=1 Tax=Streptosporangium subroseum TaxID=106412 RepID=UPI00343DDA9E